MSKKALGIIIGINATVTTAAVTIVNLLAPEQSTVVDGIITAVSGCIDGICLVFMKAMNTTDK